MTQAKFTIYVLSDATGELAHSMAIASARQFENVDVDIIRKSFVSTDEQIKEVVSEAKTRHGVIMFTMVSQEVRRKVLTESKAQEIVAIDIMGPSLDMLSNYFHTLPSAEPGLQYKVTRDYYKRTEAVEFTVKHDEGQGLDTLSEADIVLMGISRTSKTPLSIYLAYRGYRCANIPLVTGKDLPQQVLSLPNNKVFGLILSPEHLASLRTMRLKTLGRPDTETYAQPEHVQKELDHANALFAKIPGINIIDVTGKAIEEIASEIIHTLNFKDMPTLGRSGSGGE
ncbi:kinase/pyrophosphorylase [bacterium]|nr:kinase/pyrophosphorylase [bacterium]